MNITVKKALELNGVMVDDSDVDNVIFSNNKTNSFFLEISEGCFTDTRLFLAKLYDSEKEFQEAKESIDENYFDDRLYAIKDTYSNNFNVIDLYSFVKSFFEIIDIMINTREELITFLEDVDQEWLFYMEGIKNVNFNE